jgi:rhamnogalacturonyl hydrolase YesR
MNEIAIPLANSIITRYPHPRDSPYEPWGYVQGYVLAGFEKLYLSTGDSRYADYVLSFADSQVRADGSVPAFTGASLDDMMAGTALVIAYKLTGESRYRRAASTIRRAFDGYPRNPDGGFWHGKQLPHELWIDGAFMGQMFLTRYGTDIEDREACFDEALRQIEVMAARLAKPSSGLYYHGYDESRAAAWADRTTGLSPEVWSEGLGWYALILAETLSLIAPTHPGAPRVAAILRGLAEALARVQDPATGLWYQVVDKGELPGNWHDSSGSAMFVYAVKRAAQLGCVDATTFERVAERGYEGLKTKARPGADGLVDIHDCCEAVCVQTSYEAYIDFPKKVNAREAVGGMLWAATLMESN